MDREETHVVSEDGSPDRDGTVREETHVVSTGPSASMAETEVVSRSSPARRTFEIVYLVFAVADVLLLIRIALKVLSANSQAGFTGFIYGITSVLLAPFRDLLPAIVNGRSVFETSAVVAIIVYALIGYVLARLIAIVYMRNVMISQHSRSGGLPRSE